MNKHTDFSAFKVRLKTSAAGSLETRDDENAPSAEEIKNTLEKIQQTLAEAQAKNDERLTEIEKKGAADPLDNETIKRMQTELSELKDERNRLDELEKRIGRMKVRKEEREDATPAQLAHRNAFVTFLRNPDSGEAKSALVDAQKAAQKEVEQRAADQGIETRAVSTGTGSAGGFAVPEMLSNTIMRELVEISPLRQLVDVTQVGTPDYKRLVDVGGATYGWVGEGDTRTETDTPGLVEVAPTFGMIYAYPKATEESLEDIFFNVEQWLIDSALEGFAAGEENAIVNGNGTKKPTGFLNGTPTADKDGTRAFGVLQFKASGAAGGFAAADPGDALIKMQYDLKKGYRTNARYLMNKSTAGEVMLFKDGDGNYLWQPASVLGQPDRFKGYAVAETEEMPDVAADAFPVAFGDFKAGYLLADLVGLRLTKDDITTPGYVKWYIRRRIGGIVQKSEAIKLLKIAA